MSNRRSEGKVSRSGWRSGRSPATGTASQSGNIPNRPTLQHGARTASLCCPAADLLPLDGFLARKSPFSRAFDRGRFRANPRPSCMCQCSGTICMRGLRSAAPPGPSGGRGGRNWLSVVRLHDKRGGDEQSTAGTRRSATTSRTLRGLRRLLAGGGRRAGTGLAPLGLEREGGGAPDVRAPKRRDEAGDAACGAARLESASARSAGSPIAVRVAAGLASSSAEEPGCRFADFGQARGAARGRGDGDPEEIQTSGTSASI